MLPHSAGPSGERQTPRSFGNQSCGRRLRCLRDLVVGSCYQMLRTRPMTSRASSPGPETSRSPEILVKLDFHHWIGDRARGRSALRQTRLAPAGPGRTGLGSRLRVWAAFGQKAGPVLRATSCALEPRSTNNDARVTDDPSRTSMAVAMVALCPLEPARVYRRLRFGVEAATNGLLIWPAAPPRGGSVWREAPGTISCASRTAREAHRASSAPCES